MCQFFDKRGYPVSVVQAGYTRARQIHRKSALKTEGKNPPHSFHSHIAPSQPRSQIYYSGLRTSSQKNLRYALQMAI